MFLSRLAGWLWTEAEAGKNQLKKAFHNEGKLAQKEHLKWEAEAYLRFIEAIRACDVKEAYLDQTEKILEYLENH